VKAVKVVVLRPPYNRAQLLRSLSCFAAAAIPSRPPWQRAATWCVFRQQCSRAFHRIISRKLSDESVKDWVWRNISACSWTSIACSEKNKFGPLNQQVQFSSKGLLFWPRSVIAKLIAQPVTIPWICHTVPWFLFIGLASWRPQPVPVFLLQSATDSLPVKSKTTKIKWQDILSQIRFDALPVAVGRLCMYTH
jgi:hypothetical protein